MTGNFATVCNERTPDFEPVLLRLALKDALEQNGCGISTKADALPQ